MAETLLQTKLYAPPTRPNLVPRPRLVERLNRGLLDGCQLSLIAGPAGYGKTMLAGSWLRQSDRSCAWLSLDDDDNDPVRFWTYVLAALQGSGVEQEGGGLAAVQPPQPSSLTAFVAALINQLAALSRPVILVLDDYHVIYNRAIHEGLSFFIDHQPGQCHLAIMTRADPPLPLARLRGRGWLAEIRVGDLRFSPEETRVFLNEIMALELPAVDVAALAARTEGWAVGLVLAAQSMQSQADKQAFVRAFSGSHRYILEYLVEEVISHQPVAIRQFLLQTSVLSRLCGPLCDALTGGADGRQILRQLQRDNLFIVPLDDEGIWFRFHHLFTDLMGNLSRRELSPGQLGQLHRRASQWYEQDGGLDDAVRHALLSGDPGLAVDLIDRAAHAAIAQGRLVTFLGWLAELPEEQLLARPRLRVHQAWALHLSGDHEAAQLVLDDTRARLRSAPAGAETMLLRGQIAAMLVGIATIHEDGHTVIREAREALAHLPQDDLISRARVYIALGMAQAYGDDLDLAGATWQQARDLALAAGNPFLAAAAVELLAGVEIYHQGRLREGVRLLQQIVEWGTREDGRPLPFTSVAHVLLAEVHLEWNELETAAHYLEKGIDLARQGGVVHGLTYTYCAQARLRQALGDRQGALEALVSAGQALVNPSFWHMIVHQIAGQVRFRLWSGDVAGAWRWATADAAVVGRELAGLLPAYLAEVRQVALAQVHLAREEPAEALAILDTLLPAAAAARRQARVAEIHLGRALAMRQAGDFSGALNAFEQCLLLTEAEGYVRLYLEAGQPVLPLLRQAASRGIFTVYVARLLAAFESAAGPGSPDVQRQGELLVDPLSEREEQVLRLIDQGLTNREIADRLVVSLNTVKKHSGNIYGKLGVHSRTQAVARAREIGLL
ncbi:MAG: LuxR C-terminal-related transcriptional regulator [Candidatus Promineifilaceae bacterium]